MAKAAPSHCSVVCAVTFPPLHGPLHGSVHQVPAGGRPSCLPPPPAPQRATTTSWPFRAAVTPRLSQLRPQPFPALKLLHLQLSALPDSVLYRRVSCRQPVPAPAIVPPLLLWSPPPLPPRPHQAGLLSAWEAGCPPPGPLLQPQSRLCPLLQPCWTSGVLQKCHVASGLHVLPQCDPLPGTAFVTTVTLPAGGCLPPVSPPLRSRPCLGPSALPERTGILTFLCEVKNAIERDLLPYQAEGSHEQGWALIICASQIPTVAPSTSWHLIKLFLANEC